MQIDIDHITEFLCLLVAIYCYNGYRNSFMKYYLFFLIIMTITDLLNSYLYYIKKIETISIANCENLFILLFNAFIFYRLIEFKNSKKIIIIIAALFSIMWLYSNVFYAQLNHFNNIHFAAAAIVQVVFALLFYYYYLKIDIYNNHSNTSGLWVATGVLIFNAGVAICFSLFHYIYINNLTLFGKPLYNIIPQLLCIVLYTCISIALLIWKPTTKLLQE